MQQQDEKYLALAFVDGIYYIEIMNDLLTQSNYDYIFETPCASAVIVSYDIVINKFYFSTTIIVHLLEYSVIIISSRIPNQFLIKFFINFISQFFHLMNQIRG